MGIYSQARRWAVTVACTAGAVAGLSMAAPAAFAAPVCITGSGSSLQKEQQTLWTTGTGHFVCLSTEMVEYIATSSGKGLKEFGIEGTELKPTESGNGTKLDAFVGTDDAPTEAELKKTESGAKTAETKAWVAPVVSAPIAVIMHPPSGCKIKTGLTSVTVTPTHLSEAFAAENNITWGTLLGAGNVEGTCTGLPMRDVRSDSSGTSFAFKQFLCQVNGVVWGGGAGKCESGEGFVVDAATWPKESEMGKAVLKEHPNKESIKVENKGSAGEAEAVENEEGSIGYVNLANAAKAPSKFVSAKEGATIFWVNVEDHGGTGQNPEESKKGHCPTSYTFPTGVQAEAEKGFWAKVHLASTTSSGAYPICTFTYDIGWLNYKTTELEREYSNKGTAIGADTESYFEYMTSKATGEGQKKIEEYYSPLPTEGSTPTVQEIANTIAKEHIDK